MGVALPSDGADGAGPVSLTASQSRQIAGHGGGIGQNEGALPAGSKAAKGC